MSLVDQLATVLRTSYGYDVAVRDDTLIFDQASVTVMTGGSGHAFIEVLRGEANRLGINTVGAAVIRELFGDTVAVRFVSEPPALPAASVAAHGHDAAGTAGESPAPGGAGNVDPLAPPGYVVEVLPPFLVDCLKALRGWHALGHTESCACKPCDALRTVLITNEVLDMIYREPKRVGLKPGRDTVVTSVPERRFDGWVCAHGVTFTADCRACGVPT